MAVVQREVLSRELAHRCLAGVRPGNDLGRHDVIYGAVSVAKAKAAWLEAKSTSCGYLVRFTD